MARIYRDTYGHAITVDTKVSLASATAQEIHIKKPSGTTDEWTGAVSGNNITPPKTETSTRLGNTFVAHTSQRAAKCLSERSLSSRSTISGRSNEPYFHSSSLSAWRQGRL